jgi:hypothetical protein
MDKLIIKTPNEKMLEKLIIEEATIRESKEYQDKCTEVKDIPNGWLEIVTAGIQKDIAIKNGFDDPISCDLTVNMMRRAHILYPNNKIFTTVPIQVRNNKACRGTLKINDDLPNVALFDEFGSIIELKDLTGNTNQNKISIIFAGSQT